MTTRTIGTASDVDDDNDRAAERAAAAHRLLVRTRRDRGLPMHLQDDAIIEEVARIFRGDT